MQKILPTRSGLPPLSFGALQVDPPLLLAPMAGLTHSALRRLLLEQGGVGLLSTEMLAARRLPHDNPGLSPYLIRHSSETPLSYQLLLIREEDAAGAVAALEKLGAQAVDLNLGCPAPEIRRLGGGSRLMDDPALVRRLVGEVRRRTTLPLSAKIRLGESLDAERLRDFCRLLEDCGIDLLTVHARLRGEPFGRKPRWSWVARVKSWLQIPVVANGGIFSPADARTCLAQTGADGLMIGRGAAVSPWLFRAIVRDFAAAAAGEEAGKVMASGLRPSASAAGTCAAGPQSVPEVPDKSVIYLHFIELLEESFAPERRLGRLKEFTHYYARNYTFGHHLASAVQSSPDLETARQRAREFFTVNQPV